LKLDSTECYRCLTDWRHFTTVRARARGRESSDIFVFLRPQAEHKAEMLRSRRDKMNSRFRTFSRRGRGRPEMPDLPRYEISSERASACRLQEMMSPPPPLPPPPPAPHIRIRQFNAVRETLSASRLRDRSRVSLNPREVYNLRFVSKGGIKKREGTKGSVRPSGKVAITYFGGHCMQVNSPFSSS